MTGSAIRRVAAPARKGPRCFGRAQDFRPGARLARSAGLSRIGRASRMARRPRAGTARAVAGELIIKRQHFLCPSKGAGPSDDEAAN